MRLLMILFCLVALFAVPAQAQTNFMVTPTACEQALPEPISACEPAQVGACEPAYAPVPAPMVMMAPMFNQVARYYAAPRVYMAPRVYSAPVWSAPDVVVAARPARVARTKEKTSRFGNAYKLRQSAR